MMKYIDPYQVGYGSNGAGNYDIVLMGTNISGTGSIIWSYDDYEKGELAFERFCENLREAVKYDYRLDYKFLKHQDQRSIYIHNALVMDLEEFKTRVEHGDEHFNW